VLNTADVKPVERPDPSQMRDALRKGLGRALQWAKAGLWSDRDVLLEACLIDQRFDRQIDDARGPWLWQIVEAAKAIDDVREAIFAALHAIEDDFAAVQLCQFCVFYARHGDERFRQRLREIVETKPMPDCPWMGEEELIELEPSAGLVLIAQTRGRELAGRGWEWDDGDVIDHAVERLGEPAVCALLEQHSTSADVRRFRDGWHAEFAARNSCERPVSQSHAERMRHVSVEELIREAETEKPQIGLFRGWGMYADESELQTILDRLLTCQATNSLVSYLRVFSNRPMPQFDQRVFALLFHEDENVRARAYTAIAQDSHPAIRRFALDHVEQRFTEMNFLELFVKNFQPGDEELLLRHLRIPADQNNCHWLLMDLKKVLHENPGASCRDLALIAYDATPCGECRFHATRLLLDRKVAPAWLIEECRFDAESDTRELVRNLP
jgi:hypothetical protein